MNRSIDLIRADIDDLNKYQMAISQTNVSCFEETIDFPKYKYLQKNQKFYQKLINLLQEELKTAMGK